MQKCWFLIWFISQAFPFSHSAKPLINWVWWVSQRGGPSTLPPVLQTTIQVALAEEREALICCCYDANKDLSTPGGSPGCQILKDLKHLMTPRISTGTFYGDSVRPVVWLKKIGCSLYKSSGGLLQQQCDTLAQRVDTSGWAPDDDSYWCQRGLPPTKCLVWLAQCQLIKRNARTVTGNKGFCFSRPLHYTVTPHSETLGNMYMWDEWTVFCKSHNVLFSQDGRINIFIQWISGSSKIWHFHLSLKENKH